MCLLIAQAVADRLVEAIAALVPDLDHDEAEELCSEYPQELTAGPCILDAGHPEPWHVAIDGYTWAEGQLGSGR